MSAKDTKTESVGFRCSSAEKVKLARQAGKARMTMGDYILQQCLPNKERGTRRMHLDDDKKLPPVSISKFLFVGDQMVHVIGFIEDPEMTDYSYMTYGKGYIHNGYVYIYARKHEDFPSSPTAVLTSDGRRFDCRHIKSVDIDMDAWKSDLLRQVTSQDITEGASSMSTLTPAMIEAMNNATSTFKPNINPDDDFLKRLVKTTIRLKNVDLNRYKALMNKAYGLSNLKSALKSTTKMSVPAFLTWVEMLGVKVSIVIEDNGKDTYDPLAEKIFYDTDSDAIVDEKGEPFPLYNEVEEEDEL